MTNLSNKNSSGATLSSYAYTYYASGNQKNKTDNTGKVTSYVYDGLGRLTSESESGGVTLSYLYDEAGNRTKLTATGTESYVIDYIYNNVNQLTSEVKTESGATETTYYTYDANGNMLSKKISLEETQANTYNNLNQLVSSITAGVTSSYTYNVDGIRTSKTVGTTTTDYLLDGGNVVAESQNGEITATYLRGANLLSTDNGTSTSYYIFNAHGDVTGLTNGAQAVTKSYDYDAFGNEDNPSATDENPFRYCGEYYDKETGTYYLRARYYDPSIGRFTQQDTHWNVANMIYGDNPNKINEREDALGLKAYTYVPSISSIMQSGNLYVYGLNNPILLKDYNGKWAHLAVGAVVGALVGGIQSAAEQYIAYGEVDIGEVLISAAFGAVDGVFVASGVGIVGQVVGRGVTNGFKEIAVQTRQVETGRRDDINAKDVALATFFGCIEGYIGGAGKATPMVKAESKKYFRELSYFLDGKKSIDDMLLVSQKTRIALKQYYLQYYDTISKEGFVGLIWDTTVELTEKNLQKTTNKPINISCLTLLY